MVTAPPRRAGTPPLLRVANAAAPSVALAASVASAWQHPRALPMLPLALVGFVLTLRRWRHANPPLGWALGWSTLAAIVAVAQDGRPPSPTVTLLCVLLVGAHRSKRLVALACSLVMAATATFFLLRVQHATADPWGTLAGQVIGVGVGVVLIWAWWWWADRVEHAHAEGEQARAARQELIYRVALVANESQDLPGATRAVLDEVCGEHWPVGHLYLADPGSGTLTDSGVWSAQARQDHPGLVGALTRSGAPEPGALPLAVMSSGTAAAGLLEGAGGFQARLARGHGMRRAVAAPLRSGERVLGVLELLSPADDPPGAEEREFLALVGVILGRVVDRQLASQTETMQALAAERSRHALSINDEVVQGLVVSKYLLEEGDVEGADAHLSATLKAARSFITRLLNEISAEDPNAALRRATAAQAARRPPTS